MNPAVLLLTGGALLLAAPRLGDPWPLPAPTRAVLPGGVRALVMPEPALASTTLLMMSNHGALDELAGQDGALSLVAATLACQASDPGNPLGFAGGRMRARVDWQELELAVEFPGGSLDAAAQALGAALRQPALRETCLRRAEQALRLEEVANREATSAALEQALFPGHRRGRPLLGSPASRARATPASLAALWSAQTQAPALWVVVIGPVEIDSTLQILTRHLADLGSSAASPAPPPPPASEETARATVVDAPGSSLATLWIAQRLPLDSSHSLPEHLLLDEAWLHAGAPRSLAARGCRSTRGRDTAGVEASTDALILRCPGLEPESVRAVLDQAALDLGRLRQKPLAPRALRELKDQQHGRLALQHESALVQARSLARLEREGTRAEVLAQAPAKLEAISARDLQSAALGVLSPLALRAVVLGPAERLRPQLADLLGAAAPDATGDR
ncbi:MAG: hypothetical protein ABIJ09_08300 [Pseudomonadota bacterium]